MNAPRIVSPSTDTAHSAAARINELQAGLSWALDILDMFDKRLVALGDPPEKVNSAVYVAAKAKARAALNTPALPERAS